MEKRKGLLAAQGKCQGRQHCTLPGLTTALQGQAVSHFLLLASVSLGERLKNAG